ncbi:MAG: imidazole glycerol phosphate synthase subunit HisH [Alphaproteobacteria bacterium]|nr:imidazole glycerol phosphate synthase subunit HisH [Alphaproteobacteria bacterium]
MQTIAVIDYGSGNLRSVERALLEAAARANRRREVRVTSDPAFVRRADRIVLPGQGAFAECMGGLKRAEGLAEALVERVRTDGAPFLGVCVGMQLLVELGLERETTAGLAWMPGVCRKLEPHGATLPHMGWNAARIVRPHPVFDALAPAAHVYFAHSFIVDLKTETDAAAFTTHGETFASAVARDNVLGVQFHPEKSQDAGLALLARFVDWTP